MNNARYLIATRELTFYQISDASCRFKLLPNLISTGKLLLTSDQYKWLSMGVPLFMHGWEVHWPDRDECYDGTPCNFKFNCSECMHQLRIEDSHHATEERE